MSDLPTAENDVPDLLGALSQAVEAARAERKAKSTDAPSLRLRVPTNRADNPDGRLNVGTEHHEVVVIIDPTLETLGLHEPAYGCDTIRLREWNEQALLHELLHVAVSRSAWWHDPQRQVSDPNGHDLISRIEVAMWETGWRRVLPPAKPEEAPDARA